MEISSLHLALVFPHPLLYVWVNQISLCCILHTFWRHTWGHGDTKDRIGEKCKNSQAVAPLTECSPDILPFWPHSFPHLFSLLPSSTLWMWTLSNAPPPFSSLLSTASHHIISAITPASTNNAHVNPEDFSSNIQSQSANSSPQLDGIQSLKLHPLLPTH